MLIPVDPKFKLNQRVVCKGGPGPGHIVAGVYSSKAGQWIYDIRFDSGHELNNVPEQEILNA